MNYFKYILALLLISCIGCQSTIDSNNGAQFSAVIKKPSGPITGRAYIFHGYYNTAHNMEQYPYNQLNDTLLANGFELVFVNWPASGARRIRGADFQSDQGQSYITAFKNYMLQLDSSLPRVPITITSGFSFGGLHAVWANEVIHADATYSILSLVIVSVLDEFKNVDTTYADMTSSILPINFWLSYGTLDTRVDGPLIANIYSGEPFLHAYITNHDGSTLTQQMYDVKQWLTSLNIIK